MNMQGKILPLEVIEAFQAIKQPWQDINITHENFMDLLATAHAYHDVKKKLEDNEQYAK